MKKKILFFGTVFLFVFLLFQGCGEDKDTGKGKPFDPNKEVVFERFFPDSGGVGTKLIIVGDNFGIDPGLVHVTVNKVPAMVIGVNETHIYAVVPTRADTGKVAVSIGDSVKSYANHTFDKDFTYVFRQNVSTLSGHTDTDGNGDVIDGTLDEAWYRRPEWITMDRDGVIFLCEESGGIRIINMAEDKVTTPYRVSGGINRIRTACFSLNQDTLFVSHDTWDTNGVAIFMLTRKGGFMDFKPLVNGITCNFCAINPVDGEVFYNRYSTARIFRYNKATGAGVEMSQSYDQNAEMHGVFTPDGKSMYLVIRNFHAIYKLDYDFATKTFTNSVCFAGAPNLPGGQAGFANGVGTTARFNQPCQVVVDDNGFLFVADRNNHCIRQISPEGVVTTFAGTPGEKGLLDGDPLKSKFNAPEGIFLAPDGAFYVADYDNHRIRKIVIE